MIDTIYMKINDKLSTRKQTTEIIKMLYVMTHAYPHDYTAKVTVYELICLLRTGLSHCIYNPSLIWRSKLLSA